VWWTGHCYVTANMFSVVLHVATQLHWEFLGCWSVLGGSLEPTFTYQNHLHRSAHITQWDLV